MKKILYLFLAGALLAACNSKKNEKENTTGNRPADDYRNSAGNNNTNNIDRDEQASWTTADVNSFNAQCRQTFEGKEELADKLCPCLLEKMQKKYASLSEMDKNSTEEEGKTVAQVCMKELNLAGSEKPDVTEGVSWPDSEREAFMTECVKGAMGNGMSRSGATSYCSCMQENLERLHPDINELGNMSQKQVETIMKPYRDDCLKQ